MIPTLVKSNVKVFDKNPPAATGHSTEVKQWSICIRSVTGKSFTDRRCPALCCCCCCVARGTTWWRWRSGLSGPGPWSWYLATWSRGHPGLSLVQSGKNNFVVGSWWSVMKWHEVRQSLIASQPRLSRSRQIWKAVCWQLNTKPHHHCIVNPQRYCTEIFRLIICYQNILKSTKCKCSIFKYQDNFC